MESKDTTTKEESDKEGQPIEFLNRSAKALKLAKLYFDKAKIIAKKTTDYVQKIQELLISTNKTSPETRYRKANPKAQSRGSLVLDDGQRRSVDIGLDGINQHSIVGLSSTGKRERNGR
jgi:hypothetical protein